MEPVTRTAADVIVVLGVASASMASPARRRCGGRAVRARSTAPGERAGLSCPAGTGCSTRDHAGQRRRPWPRLPLAEDVTRTTS